MTDVETFKCAIERALPIGPITQEEVTRAVQALFNPNRPSDIKIKAYLGEDGKTLHMSVTMPRWQMVHMDSFPVDLAK